MLHPSSNAWPMPSERSKPPSEYAPPTAPRLLTTCVRMCFFCLQTWSALVVSDGLGDIYVAGEKKSSRTTVGEIMGCCWSLSTASFLTLGRPRTRPLLTEKPFFYCDAYVPDAWW